MREDIIYFDPPGTTGPYVSVEANKGRTYTADELKAAFVQGAKWWEYEKTDFTMWPADAKDAEMEAEKRLEAGTLGKDAK